MCIAGHVQYLAVHFFTLHDSKLNNENDSMGKDQRKLPSEVRAASASKVLPLNILQNCIVNVCNKNQS